MSKLKKVQIKVMEDSGSLFGGEPVYRKGETYSGVIDTTTNVAIISFRFGNQIVVVEDSKDFYFEISGDSVVDTTPGSIDQFIKSIDLNKWIQTNVVDKYDIYSVYPNSDVSVRNNVEGNGGSEHLMGERGFLSVQHKNLSTDLMTQVRKGSIFYIEDDPIIFRKQPLTLEAMSYQVLKEIKFIIENDYKHGGM